VLQQKSVQVVVKWLSAVFLGHHTALLAGGGCDLAAARCSRFEAADIRISN